MGRKPCCEKREWLKKGPWSAEEDNKLLAFIAANGLVCWREVSKLAGLRRCGKSCRLRWINYLRPDLKRGMLSPQEEDLIIQLHASYGNKWSRIAAQLPGRTDNEIKNCWNTRIRKKLQGRGIDPVTHEPLFKPPGVTGSPPSIARVNASPTSAGLPTNSFNYHNRKPIHRVQEGLHSSPNSVISPRVTTSLSHTPTTTNQEDELSVNYSADLLSRDHSSDSNLQASEFANEMVFRGKPHMRFQSSHDGKDGLQNAAYMPYACPAAFAQEVHASSLKAEDALYNPPHMVQTATYIQNLPHMLQSASRCILPDMLSKLPQPGAPQLVEQAFVRASQAQVQALQIKDGEGIPSKSIGINESNEGCDGGSLKGDINRESYEYMVTPMYARNAPPSLSPRPIKYRRDGGKSQPSQETCGPANRGVTSASVSTTLGGQWSNGMASGLLFTEEGERELEPNTAMSPLPLLNEPSQILGHHNVAAACNTANNMGQLYWSSMDYLWGDPMALIN